MADTENNWQKALGAIDLSAIDSLKELKQEQDQLSERLQSMEELKASVSEAVFSRVNADYRKRVNELETKAAPLKQAAREQYAKLRTLLEQFEADHESIKLDQQEIELRHKLGEFDDKEFQNKVKAIESSVKEKAQARTRALELKSKFIDAFHAESELEGEAPGQPASPAATGRMPAVSDEAVSDAVATRLSNQKLPADAQSGKTQAMPPVKAPAPPPAAGGATQIFRAARLVPQNPEAGKQTYTLTLKPMTIGADAANEIRIGGPGVDDKHAKIMASAAGFSIFDLGTKHGTRVNAEKVKERGLANEDVVQIGAARFVFREG